MNTHNNNGAVEPSYLESLEEKMESIQNDLKKLTDTSQRVEVLLQRAETGGGATDGAVPPIIGGGKKKNNRAKRNKQKKKRKRKKLHGSPKVSGCKYKCMVAVFLSTCALLLVAATLGQGGGHKTKKAASLVLGKKMGGTPRADARAGARQKTARWDLQEAGTATSGEPSPSAATDSDLFAVNGLWMINFGSDPNSSPAEGLFDPAPAEGTAAEETSAPSAVGEESKVPPRPSTTKTTDSPTAVVDSYKDKGAVVMTSLPSPSSSTGYELPVLRIVPWVLLLLVCCFMIRCRS